MLKEDKITTTRVVRSWRVIERLKRKLDAGEEKPSFSFLFLVIQYKLPMFLLHLKKNFTKKQEYLSIAYKKISLNLWLTTIECHCLLLV